MRALKTLLAASILIAFTGLAEAETVVRITGSTAFRGATLTAIKNIFDVSPAVVYGYIGSSETGAGKSIYKGKINLQDVTIKTSWSGAVGGMYFVVSQDTTTQKYLEDGNALSAALTDTGTANLTDNASAGQKADVCMLDHFQSTTPFKAPTYPNLHTEQVGIIAFKWFASRGYSPAIIKSLTLTTGSNIGTVDDTATLAVGMTIQGHGKLSNSLTANNAKIGQILDGTTFTIVKNSDGTTLNAIDGTTNNTATQSATFVSPVSIDNMTNHIAKVLYGNGSVSLATITGNAADNDKVVWGIGRDADSGTRLNAHQESGIGYNSQVKQWTPSGNPVTSHALAVNDSLKVPQAVQDQHPNAGDGGYNSGGTLAGVFGSQTPTALDDGNGGTAIGFYIGYAGISDANVAIAAGAKELTWNGVSYSDVAVQEGRYTFWGYESLGYQNSLEAEKKAVADALALQIRTVDAPAPKINTMHCQRATDGAPVIQNY